MKFVYEYRTRENVKLSGVICAASREAAFVALREQGIKPSHLDEAPGFFNKLFGKYKRWIAIVVLLFVVIALVINHIISSENIDGISYETRDGFARAIERRQIWGDEAVILQASETNWRMVFLNPAERLLALFAQPGKMQSVFPTIPESIHQDFTNALESRLKIEVTDIDEYKQMKCIVEGMKEEMREYLKDGGSIDGYLRRLVLRQREESQFIDQAKKDLDLKIINGEDGFVAWQEINKLLREQGLSSIPLPSSWEK